MPLVPNLGPQVAALWARARAALPDSCLAGHDESLHFAKYGRRPGDTELAGLGKDGGRPNGGAGDEAGEGGAAGDKIDEWQAGWNVTNAIQVSGHTPDCISLHCTYRLTYIPQWYARVVSMTDDVQMSSDFSPVTVNIPVMLLMITYLKSVNIKPT